MEEWLKYIVGFVIENGTDEKEQHAFDLGVITVFIIIVITLFIIRL